MAEAAAATTIHFQRLWLCLKPPEDGGVHFVIPEGTVSITQPVGWRQEEGEDSWVGWEVDKTKVTRVLFCWLVHTNS